MPSNMLRRVLANKRQLFQHEDGTLKLLGIYGRLMPILTLVLLQKTLEDNFDKKKVNDLFYLIGESQSYNAAAWTVKKVGIPVKGNELKIFNETINHSEITGIGKPKTLRFDAEKKFILATMQNNKFSEQYSRLFGIKKENPDYYLRGLFAGTAKFLFGEEVIVISEKIHSSNGPKEIYKIYALSMAVKKYGDMIKELIPDKELNLDSLNNFDIKRLIV